ncbi:MAG: hypothetical protein VX210_06885 [Myxococcota bacterium]|nr:hypothetical protein [Myxococcota bacterium]
MKTFSLAPPLTSIVEAIAAAGGRALLVGGWVRDHLLGIDSKDLDFEVFGLELGPLERVLRRFGRVQRVGKQFGVLRIQGLDVDFSLPRRDNKIGSGHRGFRIETDPTMSFHDAALRRDLTVNSMGFDPETQELLDPHNGQADLASRTLRATSRLHFAEDPLRGLRAIQFAARLEMRATQELIELCAKLDLSELPKERFRTEFDKWFSRGVTPSLGLELLLSSRLNRHFPGLESMRTEDAYALGCKLDAIAQEQALPTNVRIALSLATLASYFQREPISEIVRNEPQATGPWHPTQRNETAGALHLQFLATIGQPIKMQEQSMRWLQTIEWLRDEPEPALADGEMRRLATYLIGGELSLRHWLVGIKDIGCGSESWCRELETRGEALNCLNAPEPDAVQGRDLIDRGLRPGPKFAAILGACRQIQDDEGIKDIDCLIDRVLLAKGA